MPEQPNKPGGDFRDDGKVRPVEDEQAVENQGQVRPEDYPEPDSGLDVTDIPGEPPFKD